MQQRRRLTFETLADRQLLTTAAGIDVVQTDVFSLSANEHHDSVLLTNESTVPARFTLRFNGNISVNTQDLVQQIRDYEVPGQPDLPDYEKAYHYLLEFHAHDYVISGKTWLHDPTTYLNSLGAGLCDDSASALKLIWNAMGYESRVWLLSGHVVSEVNVDGRWRMYDAELRLVEYKHAEQLDGVESLAEYPHSIISPAVRFDAADGRGTNHSHRTAAFYSSIENNRICTGCFPETEERDLIFEIPAGGTLRVGELTPDRAIPNSSLFATTDISNLGLATVTIPAGSTGTLDIPLALYDIAGAPSDTLSIGNLEVSLGTDAAFEFLNDDNQTRIQTLSYENTTEPIEVQYLLNKQLTELLSQNEIEIGHVGETTDLSVELASPLAERWVFTPPSDGIATAPQRGQIVGAQFDGTEFYQVTDADVRQALHAEQDFEIQARIKINHEDASRRPVVDSFRFSFEVDSQNRPYAYYKASDGRWVTVRGAEIPDGQWTDFSVRYVDGELTLATNGQVEATASGSGLDPGYLVQDLKIGGSDHAGGLRFQGELSEVSLRAVTNSDRDFVWDVVHVDEAFGESSVEDDLFARATLESVPMEPELESVPGDITNDGRVQFDDFVAFSNNFGSEGADAVGDVNSDGIVSFLDFLVISRTYGS